MYFVKCLFVIWITLLILLTIACYKGKYGVDVDGTEKQSKSQPEATDDEQAKQGRDIELFFNGPELAGKQDNSTPCGLPDDDFKAYVWKRLGQRKVKEIRWVFGTTIGGASCLKSAVVYYE